ncbi:MAG TPA: GAF domain-containing protein, partial [Candidatus Sulfotelmatobacter sp.]|nr:GAF domain-containing protein [Candidatus Sulfotelmatobacter sp.]
MRTWTEQGRLPCLRINSRGDRRYRTSDLEAFMEQATRRARPARLTIPDLQQWVDPTLMAAAPPGSDVPPSAITERILAASTRDPDRRDVELRVLTGIARSIATANDLDATLGAIARLLRESFGYRVVSFAELTGDLLWLRAADGLDVSRIPPIGREHGLAGASLTDGRPIFAPDVQRDPRYVVNLPEVRAEIAVPIFIDAEPWGVLLVGDERPGGLSAADVELLQAVADQVTVMAQNLELVSRFRRQLEQAEALRRVSADLSSKLDLDVILGDLIDHAAMLFAADRAAVFFRQPDGVLVPQVSRGVSERFLAAMRGSTSVGLPPAVLERRRAVASHDWANGPHDDEARGLVIQEGVDTVAAAPLVRGDEVLGVLVLYHDRHHAWDQAELDVLDALAAQASIAIANARNYAQTATWAAQLQSIQKLGARLSRLTKVREIGLAICGELNQLIDYHNVRVYTVEGPELVPIAWHGEIGEYADEAEEQLRLQVGQGITGWVAEHGLAQYLPDADGDPRTQTIAGTQEHLDESLLVAPMKFEDRVLGVIVLSKLGLHQFSADDLRLLEIYGSLAAQAVRTAAATEHLHAQSAALERRVRSQQELLSLTEAMISTLDQATLLDLVAERVPRLIEVDTITLDLHDPLRHEFHTIAARGVYAEEYLRRRVQPDTDGVTGWVFQHGEAQLVRDEMADERVSRLGLGPTPGSLIVAPLRNRGQVVGVLTMERLGADRPFTQEEFDLAALVAAQTSVALQNAQAHRAVAIQAQTDGLTNLSNHTTFYAQLGVAVERAERFSVLMIDLDEFKTYNDSYGHQAGDQMLRLIARALQAAVRDTDTVFRYGGDEFTILLPGADQTGALAVAEKVRAAVTGAGRERSPDALLLTCSIGVASYPDDATDAPTLLFAADRAAYLSKRTGRDLVSTAAE